MPKKICKNPLGSKKHSKLVANNIIKPDLASALNQKFPRYSVSFGDKVCITCLRKMERMVTQAGPTPTGQPSPRSSVIDILVPKESPTCSTHTPSGPQPVAESASSTAGRSPQPGTEF